MGASTIEKGVLKLVHPGRHVEYHRKSITAGEIMRKNPRHSITRPDFFKNPGIVVHPESVMVPGQVFYIVPNKTVHRLAKNQSQQLDQSSDTSHYKHVSEQNSPRKLWAGTTPMYQFHHKQDGSNSCSNSLPHDKETTDNSSSCANSLPHDKETTSDDGLTLTFQARDYYLSGNRSRIITNYSQLETTKITRSNTRKVHVCNNKQDKNLKSCMKKDGLIKVPNLRVTFDLTTLIKY